MTIASDNNDDKLLQEQNQRDDVEKCETLTRNNEHSEADNTEKTAVEANRRLTQCIKKRSSSSDQHMTKLQRVSFQKQSQGESAQQSKVEGGTVPQTQICHILRVFSVTAKKK